MNEDHKILFIVVVANILLSIAIIYYLHFYLFEGIYTQVEQNYFADQWIADSVITKQYVDNIVNQGATTSTTSNCK